MGDDVRLAFQIPVPDGPTTRYTAAAARSLVDQATTLTLADGKRVLAVIVFAEVVEDGRALVVTLDYDPPHEARRRRRSQVTTARTSADGESDMSQSQRRSHPRSQRAEAT